MNAIKISITIFILFLFNGCTFREIGENIESIYTATEVVKPYPDNYRMIKPSRDTPVLCKKSEKKKIKKWTKEVKEPDIILSGYIIKSSYDTDVDLYVYTFLENITNNYHIFYYNKKLPYTKDDLIKVKIADNFLKDSKRVYNKDSKIEDFAETKAQKFRRIRKMQENRAACEETIITK